MTDHQHPSPPSSLGPLAVAGLSGLFLLPRIVRLTYPEVWIEDPVYLYTPYAMMQGLVPYQDFSAPYITLLEEFFSYLFMVFGPSIRVFEVVTALVVFGATWFIFLLGRRMGGTAVGLIAAVAFSWNYLIFRYHVQHREIYTTFFQLWLYWELYRGGLKPGWKRVIGIALAFGFGAVIKQSIAVHSVPVFLYLLLVCRQWLQALVFGVLFNGMYWVFMGIFYLRYGEDFLINTAYFHFAKGATQVNIPGAPPVWLIRVVGHASEAGVWILLGAVGIVVGYLRTRDPFWLLFALNVAVNIAYNLWSPTFWPHYLIDLLGVSLIGAAYLAVSSGEALRDSEVVPNGALRWLLVGATPLLASLALHPLFQRGMPFPKSFGFGEVSRAESRQVADYIQSRAEPDEVIIAPPYIGLIAQRPKLINFKDNLGNMIIIRQFKEEGRLDDVAALFEGKSFAEVRGMTTQVWLPRAKQAIQDRQVAMVIPDFELPPEFLSPVFLAEAGYFPCMHAMGLTFWCRKEL